MKLAKAMVKSVEQMQSSLKCCQKQIDWIEERRKEPPIVIDLDSIRQISITFIPCYCTYCGYIVTDVEKEVLVINSSQSNQNNGWTFLEQLDIDEAPYIE